MANTRDLLVRINGDASGFEKALGKSTKTTGGFSDSLDRAKTGSFALLGALTAAGAAVGILGAKAIGSAGQFEQYRVAFETMLGSAEKARNLMGEISEFAKTTPFELPEVVAGTKQLLAFGFAQEELLPTMRRLGDIASGVGVPVGQLTNVFGQVRIAGRLMGQDLLQFTNAGVPLISELAKVMGKPQEEIKELVSQGKIGFKEVEQAIMNMTGEGSKFGGMMDKQSKTFSGVMSNIQDSIGQTMRKMVGLTDTGEIIEGGFFDRVKGAAEAVLPILEALPDTLANGFKTLQPYFPVIIGAIVGGLVPAFVAMAAAAWAAVAPLLPFIAAGAAIGFAAKLIIDRMGGVQAVFDKVRPVIEVMMMLWRDHLQPAIMSVFSALGERLIPALKRLWDQISPILIPVLKVLGTILGAVVFAQIMIFVKGLQLGISWLSNIINWISNVIQWVKNLVGWFGRIGSSIGSGMSNVQQKLTAPFKAAFNAIANLWNNTVGQLSFKAPDWVPGIGGKGFDMPKIPTFQKGVENFEGGLAYVHKGEILANLPPGTDVVSAARTQNLMNQSGGGGTTLNFNPTLQVGMFAGMPTEYREVAERMWVEFMRIAKSNGINLENIGARVQ
jgi:tape measure domain-containing protein